MTFDKWWKEIGSGMHPLTNEDQHEHVYRVTYACWSAACWSAACNDYLTDEQIGAIAYELTKRLIIDMPTAQSEVYAAIKAAQST